LANVIAHDLRVDTASNFAASRGLTSSVSYFALIQLDGQRPQGLPVLLLGILEQDVHNDVDIPLINDRYDASTDAIALQSRSIVAVVIPATLMRPLSTI